MHNFGLHNNKAIEINKLSVGFRLTGKKQSVLQENIMLSARKGELVALIGHNGVGKSTLLRTLTGLQPALKGKITIDHTDLKKFSQKHLAKKISFVSTEKVYIENLDVFSLIGYGRSPYSGWLGITSSKDEQIITSAAASVGISHLLSRNINKISDGEKQRAMIAKSIAQQTDIIILDEPTAFLDLRNKYELVNLLFDLTRQHNKTIIFSTHDLNIAMKKADKIWIMLDNLTVQGAPEDMVETNIYEKIFENENVIFDIQKGQFDLVSPHKHEIYTSDPESLPSTIKLALARLGIKPVKDELNYPSVHIEDNRVIVDDKINRYTFDNIYDLSLYLNHYLNHLTRK